MKATERSIVMSVDNKALRAMIESIRGRIPAPQRREFLKKSAAALLALVGGGALASCNREPVTEGIRPDRPEPPTTGIQPDRPVPPATKGSRPDRPETKGK